MKELIDKNELLEKIEELEAQNNCGTSDFIEAKEIAFNQVKEALDSLEVKEVDLEKHLKEDIEDVFFDLDGVAVKGATRYLTVEDVKGIAKHFYELGLKVAQKGE